MSGTLVKRVMLKIVADDGDSEVKLGRISEKADELARKHPELAVRVRTAEANAKLTVLRQELRATAKEAEKVSILSRIGGGIKHVGNLLPGAGLFAAGAGALSIAGPFAAGATAVSAFGAVAIPIFRKILLAHQNLITAQQQYDKATTKAGRAAALRAEAAATAGLTTSQKHLMGQVTGLQHAWGKLENKLTPVVADVATMGLTIARSLMPAIAKLAPAGAVFINLLLVPLSKLVSSPFFSRFASQMATLAVQAGQVLGPALVGVLKVFMRLFMQAGPAGLQILGQLLPAIITLTNSLIPVIVPIAKITASFLTFTTRTHLLIPLLGLLAAGILAVQVAAAPGEASILAVAVAVGVLAGAVVWMSHHWRQAWAGIKTVALDAWHFLGNRVIHPIEHGIAAVVNWIRSHWRLLPAIIGGPAGVVVTLVLTHWHQITRGTQHLVTSVLGFFRSLPHRIISALGNLGHLLWQGGVNLIMGLVHGIESVASAPVHALGGIISEVRKFLPFSPAKRGPLSGSGSPDIAGRQFGLMFAGGITGSTSAVSAAAERMARVAAGSGYRAAGGYAGRGGRRLELTVRVDPNAEPGLAAYLIQTVRYEVRDISGGDVQAALGTP